MDNLGPHLGQQRVHIVPLGYEYDRIVEPLRRSADLVYLLVDDPTRGNETGTVDFDAPCTSQETDSASWIDSTEYQREVRDEIDSFASVGGYPVQITDFYDVMGVVTTIAAHHNAGSPSGDNVYVNISSGPHVAAVAAAVGCMAVGARPYSIEPEEHAYDRQVKPQSKGAKSFEEIPMHPIKSPSRDQITVLRFVSEQTDKGYSVNKSSIIRHFESGSNNSEAGLACLRGTEKKTKSSKYGQLDSKVLNVLNKNGYINIEKRGRSKYVEITDSGQNILIAFGHLL